MFIAILSLFGAATAFAEVPKNVHWLPSLQLDLFRHGQDLSAAGHDRSEVILEANRTALAVLDSLKPTEKNSTRRSFLELNEAYDLLKDLNTNPLINGDLGHLYDPESKTGFCFGRAAWVWLNAIRMGLSKEAIKKVFLIGPMNSYGRDWQFHVATAVRIKKKGLFFDSYEWMVIDNNFTEPKSVNFFYENYLAASTDKKLRLFISDPQRLGASNTIKFGPAHFKNPKNDTEYNAYFKDMLKTTSTRVQLEHTNKCEFLFIKTTSLN